MLVAQIGQAAEEAPNERSRAKLCPPAVLPTPRQLRGHPGFLSPPHVQLSARATTQGRRRRGRVPELPRATAAATRCELWDAWVRCLYTSRAHLLVLPAPPRCSVSAAPRRTDGGQRRRQDRRMHTTREQRRTRRQRASIEPTTTRRMGTARALGGSWTRVFCTSVGCDSPPPTSPPTDTNAATFGKKNTDNADVHESQLRRRPCRLAGSVALRMCAKVGFITAGSTEVSRVRF